jgi:peptidoglycan/LPS O-acetylase OafA/YrhL
LWPSTTTTSEALHVLRHVLISESRFATFDQPSLSNVRAVAMVGGVLATILGTLRVPLFRRAPLALTLLCLGALVSPALVFGGSYPGRTSLHFVPFATAMFVGTLATDRLYTR